MNDFIWKGEKRKVAVDFDGVICKRKGIPRTRDWQQCKPTKYAREALELLNANGYEVYILTNRRQAEFKEILDWLIKYKITGIVDITNRKLKHTTAYIDDRAIRFTNWLDITKYFV